MDIDIELLKKCDSIAEKLSINIGEGIKEILGNMDRKDVTNQVLLNIPIIIMSSLIANKCCTISNALKKLSSQINITPAEILETITQSSELILNEMIKSNTPDTQY